MRRAKLTVPAEHVPAFVGSLVALYGAKAEAIQHTIAHADTLTTGGLWLVRGQRAELIGIERVLNQLSWDPTPTDDHDVDGDREVLIAAVHGMLCDATEALDRGCQEYLHGRGLATLTDAHRRVAAMLGMLAEIETTSVSSQRVFVTLDDETAQRVRAVARRTGRSMSEVVSDLLDSYLFTTACGGDPSCPGQA